MPKISAEIDTVPVKKTRMLIPDVTYRRGRRNWVKLGDLNLMNSTKNGFAAHQSCSKRFGTGMQFILKIHWKIPFIHVKKYLSFRWICLFSNIFYIIFVLQAKISHDPDPRHIWCGNVRTHRAYGLILVILVYWKLDVMNLKKGVSLSKYLKCDYER